MPRTERRAPTSMSLIIGVLFCSAADKSTTQDLLTLADLRKGRVSSHIFCNNFSHAKKKPLVPFFKQEGTHQP